MWKSLKNYIAAFGKWGLLMAAILVGDVLGIIQSYYTEWLIPTWGWWLILVIILVVSPFLAFHKLRVQKDELRVELQKDETSPRIASPQLFFEHVDFKFIGDNPPLLLIHLDVMPTGSMYLEQAKIEILGRTIPYDDWKTETVSPSITFGFVNHCEITGRLPTGNHTIRVLVYSNQIWWTSDWQTITYSPSVLDKEGSQTE